MKRRYEGDVPPESQWARQSFARLMRDARKEANLTQEELAHLTGTQKSNISRLESGRYNPSLDFMVKLAGSLGRSISIDLK